MTMDRTSQQLEISGTAASAQQAQDRRDQAHGGRLRGRVPQREVDFGLFDTGARDQRDLFD